MSSIVDQFGRPVTAVDAVTATRGPRMANPRTGMGGAGDRDLGHTFVARRMEREEAERLYQMSWAARKGVNIIVDDMFQRGRRWLSDDEGIVKAMEEAEDDLRAMPRLAAAMKAGRLFGSALLIVCPTDGQFDQPLRPEDVQEGGIANLWVVDRWSCSVQAWHTDPTQPKYGDPYQYRVSGRIFGSPSPDGMPGGLSIPTSAANVLVNADRVIRFDGHDSPLTEGWTTGPWEREWGVSILTPAVDEVLRDAAMHAAIGQLVQEASVWVQSFEGLKEGLLNGTQPGEVSIEDYAAEQHNLRSIYRTWFRDSEDTSERVSVPFSGLPQLMDRQAHRVAAIFGLPITRFLGTSAVGMNATGEGDARDWRLTVAAQQKSMLDPVLRGGFDMMVARHAGLAEPPDHEWIPLGESTDKEDAEITEIRSKTARETYTAGLIDEEEARERLSKDDWWDELGPWVPPPLPEPDPAMLVPAADPAMLNGNGGRPGNTPA